MKFSVSEEIVKKYPDVKIGVIVANKTDNKGKNEETISLLKDVQNSVKINFNADTLSEHPTINFWREIYFSFGSKPSDYRSSVEALIRSVLKGREIPHINKIVDLYNFISLKYVIPAGGEDLDKVNGNISLKFATGNETFIPLNSDSVEQPYAGEIIYSDENDNVLCRRWNWREADKTKLTEQTKSCIIVLEGFDDTVEKAVTELSDLIIRFCGGNTNTFIVGKNNPEIEW